MKAAISYQKRRILIDFLVVLGLGLIVLIVSMQFDLFEAIQDWAAHHEDWNIDEIFVATDVLFLAMLIFAFRRVADLRREHAMLLDSEMAISESEEKYRTLMETAAEAIMTIDAETGLIIEANEKARDLLDRDQAEILILHFHEIFSADSKDLAVSCYQGLLADQLCSRMELALQKQDQGKVPVSISMSKAKIGGRMVVQCIVQDITHLKLVEEDLKRKAFYDLLTEVPNRHYFMEQLTTSIHYCQRNRLHLALFFMDLDGFKGVNDRLGHQAGDLLLKEVGKRLKASLRSSDLVGRYGGDEFVVAILNFNQARDLDQLANHLISKISEPVVIDGQSITVGASLGISLLGEGKGEANELIRQSDSAMYQAKQKGKGTFVYYSECA